MKQTEYAGLNQWDLTDRILMKGFNADNQRIDEVLRCHPSRELLARIGLGREAEKLVNDISEVERSPYLAWIVMLVISVLYSRDHAPNVLAFGLSDRSSGGTTHLNKCNKITIDRNRRLFCPGDRCALFGGK